MSQEYQSNTEGPVSEELIRDQVDTCNEKVSEIMDEELDVSEESNIYEKIDGYLGNVENATFECFTNRRQTSTLFDQLKWLLRGLIQERGEDFVQKLQYDTKGINDNPVELCHWYKLYSTVGLRESINIKHLPAIRQFNTYRVDNISHPSNLPSPEGGTDPVLLSHILLIWYAIEELIDLWRRVLDEENLDTNLATLEDGNDFGVGFISKMLGDHGFITSYQEGEAGKSIRIEPKHVGYFPSEGDIVYFQAEQRTRGDGSEYNHLTPVIDDFQIEPYP
jgi:hypothetical protein